MPALQDFATWESLLALLRSEHADRLAAGTGHVAGSIGSTGWSLPLSHRLPPRGQPTVPYDREPVAGLPRLRTLTAHPGTLADPLEIAGLTGLEYLGLGPDEWRVLLGAGAVRRGLSAACVEVRGDEHPLAVVEVANDLLALWGRPPIAHTAVEGHLGPVR